MKMRRFLLNKLARDKTVERFTAHKAVVKSKILEDNNEYLEAMTQKIVEELEEVFDSQSQEELIVELADFEEVMDAFKKLVDIDQKDIDDVRKAKGAERGFFGDRVFVEHVDVPESATEILEYVEAQPDKYPEVDPKTGEFLESDDEDA
ncbi:MAG: putative house-cleaning noncanonical NTP pyrophosphatase (MazG superfamily) [Alteromonas naphthalenivorans]|jgi:predicted house-cleaning noncanonical NTP pyrophosphatase (MazG superfamily)